MTRDRRYLESLVPPKIKSEGFEIEWKASARWSLREKCIDKDLVQPILKSIVAFLNSKKSNGKILVGYDEGRGTDEGNFCGIEKDGYLLDNGKVDQDKWGRYIIDSLINVTKETIPNYVEIEFYEYSDGITCALICVERTEKELVEYSYKNTNKIYYRHQHQNIELTSQALIEDHKTNRATGSRYRGGWATNSIDGNIDNELFRLDWKDMGVVTQSLKDDIPAVPGLYVYTTENKFESESILFKDLKTIAYVGRATKSLKQRYVAHWREEDFVSCRKLYDNKFKFYYLEHDDDGMLITWEKEIIKFYGPSINKKIG